MFAQNHIRITPYIAVLRRARGVAKSAYAHHVRLSACPPVCLSVCPNVSARSWLDLVKVASLLLTMTHCYVCQLCKLKALSPSTAKVTRSYVVRALAMASCRHTVQQSRTGLITGAITMYQECPCPCYNWAWNTLPSLLRSFRFSIISRP
jgi:hypothetical protein